MDLSLKPCSSTTATLQNDLNCGDDIVLDRFTNLPDELLIRILSLLPTKDAAVTSILSKRMSSIFPFITSIDFDDSPISHCLTKPFAIQRFPTFVALVNSALSAYKSQYLTRFKLGVGVDFMGRCCLDCESNLPGEKDCCPDLKASQINAWISFPLTHCGLRELDLRIQVKKPGDCLIPLEIFTFQTLEVLKLDVNLSLDQISTMSSFHLPNLKRLQLRVPVISEVGFVTRLVSICPILEDLMVDVVWSQAYFINISSPSHRKLCLFVNRYDYNDVDNKFVTINTPNLEYLNNTDYLTLQYSVPNMNSLVKADVDLRTCTVGPSEVCLVQVLNLISVLSNLRHLTLGANCVKVCLGFLFIFYYYFYHKCEIEWLFVNFWLKFLSRVDLKDRLPVFHNMKCLELLYDFNCWDKLLPAFLNENCSPVLETLVFPQGLTEPRSTIRTWIHPIYLDEREFCRNALAVIPSCCKNHLKRIVIKHYCGGQREISLIQFLLTHALALEELVVFRSKYVESDRKLIEDTLQKSERVSTCSIQVLNMADISKSAML